MFKSFKEQKELKKKAEGKVVELPNEKEVLEVSTEPVDTKIEKDDKNTFEEFKVLYKGQIDDKCLEDYGTIEDEKLWEDTAKELFMASEDYIPDEDDKAEKIEEAKEVKKESKVTDYIDKDELDILIKNNKVLGNVTKNYEAIEDMILDVTTDMGHSYYKVIKNDDGSFEAYWIDKSGKKLGDSFILKENKDTSDRYQVREFEGPGAKFGVYDTKEKKFVQKGSKYIMNAACKDLNEKGKVTESSIIKSTLKEMMSRKQEAIEEGACIFELKFDCSNEDTFGVGYELENSISDILYKVADKVKSGMLDSSILDINGNKIGSYGLGYEGVQSGLTEATDADIEAAKKDSIEKGLYCEARENDVEKRINQAKEWKEKVENAVEADDLEDIANEILEATEDIKDINYAGEDIYSGFQRVMDNGDAEARGPVTYVKSVKRDMQNILDDFIDNYEEAFNEESLDESKTIKKEGLYDECYQTSDRTTLKEIALNAIYVADNDNLIIKELKSRLSDDEKKEWKIELNNFIAKPYDYIANNYFRMPLELLREIALDAVYVANDDATIREEIKERGVITEEVEEEIAVTDGENLVNSAMVIYVSNETYIKYYNLDKPLTINELKNIRLKIKNHEMYVTDIADKLGAKEVKSKKELIPNTYIMKIKESDFDNLNEGIEWKKDVHDKNYDYHNDEDGKYRRFDYDDTVYDHGTFNVDGQNFSVTHMINSYRAPQHNSTFSISSIHPYDDADYHWASAKEDEGFYTIYYKGRPVEKINVTNVADDAEIERVAKRVLELDVNEKIVPKIDKT